MSYSLTIEPLGRTIEVNDGQTILDAALREGIYLPHGVLIYDYGNEKSIRYTAVCARWQPQRTLELSRCGWKFAANTCRAG